MQRGSYTPNNHLPRRLIRAFSLTLCFLLTFTLLPAAMQTTAAETASISFETIPAKGGSDVVITGNVTLPDGAVNYSDYRITAYIQVEGDTWNWWGPKPAAHTPKTSINTNGRFKFAYASPGEPNDLKAVKINVYLIEKDHPLGSALPSGSGVIAVAAIERADGGVIRVNSVPWTGGVEDYSGFDAQFPGARKDITNAGKYSVNYSPYTGGLVPGGMPSEAQVRAQLTVLSYDFDSVRFFTAEDSLLFMYDIADELGFNVIGTAWIDKTMTEAQITKQLDNLITLANQGKVAIACVGSEVIFRKDKTPAQLLAYIDYVKAGITAGVPVTYMDTSAAFNGTSYLSGLEQLNEACDLILFSHYPIFSNNYNNPKIIEDNGGVIPYAVTELQNAYRDVKSEQGLNKPCIMAETGWPTGGTAWIGSARPDMTNARLYWDAVQAWAAEKDVDVFWFSAFDERWKPKEGGLDGTHWGLFDENGKPKESFADLFDDRSNIITDAKSDDPVTPKPDPDDPISPTPGSHNFVKKRVYDNRFTDLNWSADWVAKAFEYGVIAGTSTTTYGTTEDMSIQNALVIGSRIYAIYHTGSDADLTNGAVYPDTYIDYALENGITDGRFAGRYADAATRAELAYIWGNVLPKEELKIINAYIPVSDVNEHHPYYESIKLFYQAGIVTGNPDGKYYPDNPINRGECAVMFVRLVSETDRSGAKG